jgi:cytochrome c oxidase subunit 1
LIFFNLIQGLRKGQRAGDNPWGGATLEWQISSPPPINNFEKIPVVEKGPYEFR